MKPVIVYLEKPSTHIRFAVLKVTFTQNEDKSFNMEIQRTDLRHWLPPRLQTPQVIRPTYKARYDYLLDVMDHISTSKSRNITLKSIEHFLFCYKNCRFVKHLYRGEEMMLYTTFNKMIKL